MKNTSRWFFFFRGGFVCAVKIDYLFYEASDEDFVAILHLYLVLSSPGYSMFDLSQSLAASQMLQPHYQA